MSGKVDVRSIQALEDMERTLQRTQSAAIEIIAAANNELASLLDWITGKEHDARYRLSQAESRFEECCERLSDCEQSGYYDDDDEWVSPECSDYSYDLDNAERDLREAREIQGEIASCAYLLRQAAEDFSARARNFQFMATDHMDGARFFMKAKIEALRHFLALTAPGN